MIYIVGSLNMDLVVETPYMPKEGETLTGSGFFTNCGGKGANQAVAAAKLGGKVAMCGAVGNDEFGLRQLSGLQSVGVDVSHIKTISGVSSGIAIIVVCNENNRIILDKGANNTVCEQDIDNFLAGAKSGDVYLTQLENPVDVIGYGLKVAKKKGMTTILNPAPANLQIESYFEFVDYITPNETELALFGGKQALFTKGIKRIVTTLGGDGYEIADVNGAKKYPCHKVKVVDTTSAGDTLCGGLAVGLSEGQTLEQSCAFGSKAATIACMAKGAQQSIPTRKQVEEFVFESVE